MAWAIECTTGLLACSLHAQSQNPDSSVELTVYISLMDACLNFIIIPSIYLLNIENNKRRIIDEGWIEIFGNIRLCYISSAQKIPPIEMVWAPIRIIVKYLMKINQLICPRRISNRTKRYSKTWNCIITSSNPEL